MSPEELQIKERADMFANAHKKEIAKEVGNLEIFPAEENPVSVFMAGSPGAGKTEASVNLLSDPYFSNKNGQSILRIDPDELRKYFKDYNGNNSYLFQGAISILVSKIHDNALDNNQTFIFDGTLSKIDIARENISRSISRKRFVQILYVYQDPFQAWAFVQKRELEEGRRIPKERFIDQYFMARETVNTLKKEFGVNIQIDLLVKNIDGSDQYYKANIDVIDNHIPEKYSKEYLQKSL